MNARRKLTYLLAIIDLIVVSWAIAVIVDCL